MSTGKASKPQRKIRRVAVTGSRYWSHNRSGEVENALGVLPDGVTLILGDCPTGVDALARKAAATLGIDHVVCRADWRRYGLRAGPVRNAAMLDRQPDEVWYFHDNLAASKGTRDCVRQALNRGIRVRRMGGVG